MPNLEETETIRSFIAQAELAVRIYLKEDCESDALLNELFRASQMVARCHSLEEPDGSD